MYNASCNLIIIAKNEFRKQQPMKNLSPAKKKKKKSRSKQTSFITVTDNTNIKNKLIKYKCPFLF